MFKMRFCDGISLKKDDKGDKVLIAQKWLNMNNLYSGKLDGSFGPVTEKAVISYQSKHGLKKDGIIGPVTCKDMQLDYINCDNIWLQNGSNGYVVYLIQWHLKQVDYQITIDGDYGDKTTATVKDYQSKNGLTADGIFGPIMCRKLLGTSQETKTVDQPKPKIEDEPSPQKETPPVPEGIIKAYWVWAKDAMGLNPDLLRQQGITDLFILIYRFGGDYDYKTFLPKVIAKFEGNPRIHAWMKCFIDNNGKWVNPVDEGFRNKILDIVGEISSIPGLSGIHLDYIRYPGNANGQTGYINDFVSKVRQKCPDKTLSAALMPEGENNAKYYGQDYAELAKYLDWLCPMIYKGNYKTNTAWIGKTTVYINSKAQGKVIAGLQTYKSDDNPTKLPELELNGDIKVALEYGAKGFALFRWGLSNFAESKMPQSKTQTKPIDGWQKVPSYTYDAQDTNWTCGPSSSVMALSELGIYAEESKMAVHEKTVVHDGTSPGNLCYGIVEYGKEQGVNLQAWLQRFSDTGWQKLGDMIQDPNIAVIAHGKTGGWKSHWIKNYSHYVYPIAINRANGIIEIADPKKGKIMYSLSEFKAGLDMNASSSLIIIKKV